MRSLLDPHVGCAPHVSRAVRAVSGRLVSTGDSPVITSGRTDGRSPGGLADYLRELGQQQDRMQA